MPLPKSIIFKAKTPDSLEETKIADYISKPQGNTYKY